MDHGYQSDLEKCPSHTPHVPAHDCVSPWAEQACLVCCWMSSGSPPGVLCPPHQAASPHCCFTAGYLQSEFLFFRKRAKVQLLHNKGCHLCTVHRMVNCPGLYRSSFSKLILLRSIRATGAANSLHPDSSTWFLLTTQSARAM
jgi:hypothetical protein